MTRPEESTYKAACHLLWHDAHEAELNARFAGRYYRIFLSLILLLNPVIQLAADQNDLAFGKTSVLVLVLTGIVLIFVWQRVERAQSDIKVRSLDLFFEIQQQHETDSYNSAIDTKLIAYRNDKLRRGTRVSVTEKVSYAVLLIIQLALCAYL